jgi:hypothetical protein
MSEIGFFSATSKQKDVAMTNELKDLLQKGIL